MSQQDETGLKPFFQNQALYGRYRWPTLFVAVAGLVWAMQPIAVYYSLGADVGDQIQNAIAVDAFVHFTIPAALWLYFWITFALLSHYSGAVRALAKYYIYQGKELPIGVVIGRFPSEWRGYNQLTAEYAGEPLLIGSLAGSCIFLLISIYIWTFVIYYSTNIEDRTKVRAIATLPTLGYVSYAIVSHFGL
jgi:hypothetical protein